MNEFEVGALVRCGAQPEWGVGQVQSVVGDRVTVMFEEVGKVVFRLDAAEAAGGGPALVLEAPPRAGGW